MKNYQTNKNLIRLMLKKEKFELKMEIFEGFCGENLKTKKLPLFDERDRINSKV